MIPSQIIFFGTIFDPKKVPGPECRPGNPKSDPGLKNPSLGLKKQKMRAEKPCRTPALEFQTEPYSASYGQKTFLRVSAKILKYLGTNPVLKKGNPVFKKGHPAFKKGHPAFKNRTPAFKKWNPAFKKGNPACKKGNPACKKGNPAFKKGNPNGTMGPMGPWDQEPWDQGPWDQGPWDRDQGPWDQGPGPGTG